MNTFYGSNPSSASCKSAIHAQNPTEKSGSLGIFTKTQVSLTPQGFQRVHDFLLQDQSAKLLPKERVSNCLKKRIDKTKLREIKYNEERKRRIGATCNDVAQFGFALFVPNKSVKNVEKN